MLSSDDVATIFSVSQGCPGDEGVHGQHWLIQEMMEGCVGGVPGLSGTWQHVINKLYCHMGLGDWDLR